MRVPKVGSIFPKEGLNSLANKTTNFHHSFTITTSIRRNGKESKTNPESRIDVNLDFGDWILKSGSESFIRKTKKGKLSGNSSYSEV
jgi:hypothetical protein